MPVDDMKPAIGIGDSSRIFNAKGVQVKVGQRLALAVRGIGVDPIVVCIDDMESAVSVSDSNGAVSTCSQLEFRRLIALAGRRVYIYLGVIALDDIEPTVRIDNTCGGVICLIQVEIRRCLALTGFRVRIN